MKINALEIDGYGLWSGLKIERLADGLNVIYGPNEAGKTTLLQFIRSMLYGFSAARRQYLPPLHGGSAGGMIDIGGPQGRFEVARHVKNDGSGEELALTAADGTRHGEHLVKTLLSNIDEAIFNNVFAVELREMQELATLSDTEAAELLYNLTAGLDRISLVEVLRELEAARNRILDAEGRTSQIAELWGRREELHAEIDQLGSVSRRWSHLVGQRNQIDRELVQLEDEKNQTQRQLRVSELALALGERWARRKAIDDQLAALGPVGPAPDGAIERLDALNARIKKHEERIARLKELHASLAAEAAESKINRRLHCQAARIEALLEQQPWLASLQTEIDELDVEISKLQGELDAQRQRLGLDGNAADHAFTGISARSLAALRGPATALRTSRAKLREAKRQQNEAEKAARSLTEQIETALAARGESDLGGAMNRRGNLVAQYRRRLQIDERLDQLARNRNDLEEQIPGLVAQQVLPAGVLIGLGAAFVMGMALVLAGLLMPASIVGSAGWALAILGLVGGGGAVAGKVLWEKSRAAQLEGRQKQLLMLKAQAEQLKSEREQLDAQLPQGGGPMVSRLDAAEKDLASLEELVPLETRRNSANQQATTAAARASEAKEEYKSALDCWSEALKTVGLPERLSTRQVRQLAQVWRQLGESQRRLGERRQQAERLRQERERLEARISTVASDAGVALEGTDAIEHLAQLGKAIAHQEAAVKKRKAAARRARHCRLRAARHAEAASLLRHRCRQLFFQVGAEDETQFRHRVLQHARANVLLRDRDALTEDITAAIGKQCSEAAIGKQLEEYTAKELEARAASLRQRLEGVETQIRQSMEKRGELSANIQTLVNDRQLPDKQLELGVVETRLAEAAQRWQVLAATCLTLERIRAVYERQRQPETLQEASTYFERLTQGRYRRVWTPLGENVLRVDDAEDRTVPVEMLSRGTREQLFLSLRMALAATYARRGAALPMVLDDVLVNFDADRAAAAAAVLRDFAAAGHQLLVFTCHEHISSIFAAVGAPVSRLPGASGGGLIPVVAPTPQEEPEKEAKRPRNRAAKRKVRSTEERVRSAEYGVRSSSGERKPDEETETADEVRPATIAKPKAKTQGVFDADFFDSPHSGETKAPLSKYEEACWEADDERFFGPDDASAEAA